MNALHGQSSSCSKVQPRGSKSYSFFSLVPRSFTKRVHGSLEGQEQDVQGCKYPYSTADKVCFVCVCDSELWFVLSGLKRINLEIEVSNLPQIL